MNFDLSKVLPIIALVGMVGIGGALICTAVPKDNHDYFLIVLGALAGALTASGAQHAATQIRAAQGDVNIQPQENKE